MIFTIKNNLPKSSIILVTICVLISIYFLLQLWRGDYAVSNLSEKEEQLDTIIKQYEANQMDLNSYERKIKALDPKNLDLDVLEEEMRNKMLYTKDNEIILLQDAN